MHDKSLSEQKQKEEIIKFYDSQVKTYDDIEDFSYWNILYSEYDKWIKKYLKCSFANIAELGCGTGLQTRLLLEDAKLSFNNIFTIDICEKFLKKAIVSHSPSKRFFPNMGDIVSIPFKDNSVDAAVCMNTFDHIANMGKTIPEIKRICKKKGLFIFDITSSMAIEPYALFSHGKNSLQHYLNKFTKSTVPYAWSIKTDDGKLQKIKTYRHSPTYIENLLKSNGFKILNKKGVHICNSVIPEQIQVNSDVKVLSKINNICHGVDELLNTIPFMQNFSMYVLYACRLSN